MEAGSHQTHTPPPPPAEGLIERLAEKLGSSARASAVFGEPVERDGVTVIPVAKARWGFGGGGGGPRGGRRRRRDAGPPAGEQGPAGEQSPAGGREGEGSGGGGGVTVVPVGFIEVSHGEARFRRIMDQGAVVALAAMALAAAAIAWRVGARLMN